MREFMSPLIVWYAVILHTCWGVMLLVNDDALGATSIHPFIGVNRWLMACLFFTISAAAAWSVASRAATTWQLFALAPQQLILMWSACGSALAIWHSMYGDGVGRPRLFILADQLPVILTMFIHTAAVIAMCLAPSLSTDRLGAPGKTGSGL
jgi:hypothetical protein